MAVLKNMKELNARKMKLKNGEWVLKRERV